MFTFNDKSSKDFNIIVDEIDNLIAKATLTHEIINVEGRDDAEYIPLGYAPVNVSLKLQLLDTSRIDDVFAWLNGIGSLVHQNRTTTARIFAEIAPVRASTIKVLNVDIIRSPFWYKLNDEYIPAISEVINEGSIVAKPLIKLIKGTADVIEVRVGGVQFEYNFNGEPEVIIDCIEKEARFNGLLRNRQLTIGYDFPVLQIGLNTLELLKGDAIIQFKRKDVWL